MIIPSRVFDPAKEWNLSFDGNDSVAIPYLADYQLGTNNFSVEFWAYPVLGSGGSTDWDLFWSMEGSSWFYIGKVRSPINNGWVIRVSIGGTSYNNLTTAIAAANINRWVFVQGAVDRGNNRMDIRVYDPSVDTWYEDDVTLPAAGDITVDGDAHIGQTGDGTNYVSNNTKICGTQTFNYARTKAQAIAGMYRRLTGRESGLIGYYPFLDKTGATLKDWSNNGNDGTITGATWTKGT